MIFIENNGSLVNSSSFLNGTSPFEVFSLTFYVPLCSLVVWAAAQIFSISFLSTGVIEAIALNNILLLALTLLNSHLQVLRVILCITLVTLLYCMFFQHYTIKQLKQIAKSCSQTLSSEDAEINFVGSYRGHLLLATCICILAVDFQFFPSRFAKTQTYGWSIMDAGVGSFVLLHGLCSSHSKRSISKRHGLKKCVLSALPLFLLGFIRFVTTAAVGYHKVVSEYGVHWNFFFTLAFTKMICYTVLDALQGYYPGLLSIATLSFHQYLLSYTGLTSVIVSDDRSSFFTANKEGIGSLLGFMSLYFGGVALGQLIWKHGHKINDYVRLVYKLYAIGIVCWILMFVFHGKVQLVSRRMANLSYCVWIVSLTSLQLAVHLCHELMVRFLCALFKKPAYTTHFWNVINYNGLFYFLLANLLTGLVNLSIDTYDATDNQSLFILMSYLFTLTVSSYVSYKFALQLKFW